MALACAALVAAAAGTVVAAPAQATHGVSGGVTSSASAELKIAEQLITSLTVCRWDENGNVAKKADGTDDCDTHAVGLAADSVKLVLNYALVKSETHVPQIDAVGGVLPAASCPTAPPNSPQSSLQNKPGASVRGTGASFQSGSGITLIVSRGGAQQGEPMKIPPGQSNKHSVNGVGASVCLL